MANLRRPLVFIGFVIFNMKQMLVAPQPQPQPQVPCYFNFGDSITDNGNNNNLMTDAKANYPPYGIDFPGGTATGRFTNGRNLADFFGQLLGFADFIPPFASAQGDLITEGVNYASGAAGIRDETGVAMGDRISLNRQLKNHATTISQIANILLKRRTSLQQHLNKCLYTVVIGSNDYLNNYFLPQFYPTSRIYTPDQYAAALIKQYSWQLQILYSYGARKVALFGLGALGCIPAVLNATSSCVDSINDAVELFNNRLKPLVDDLNSRLPNAKFIYLNASSIQSGDPTTIGLQFFTQPCCQVASTGQCIPGSIPCSNRNQYAFYDNLHPTEIVYKAFAERAYNSVLYSDAYPMDIGNLARS